MTNIKLTRNIGGHNAGDAITVTPKTADYLTEHGYVEAPKTEPKPEPKTRTKKPNPTPGGDS